METTPPRQAWQLWAPEESSSRRLGVALRGDLACRPWAAAWAAASLSASRPPSPGGPGWAGAGPAASRPQLTPLVPSAAGSPKGPGPSPEQLGKQMPKPLRPGSAQKPKIRRLAPPWQQRLLTKGPSDSLGPCQPGGPLSPSDPRPSASHCTTPRGRHPGTLPVPAPPFTWPPLNKPRGCSGSATSQQFPRENPCARC